MDGLLKEGILWSNEVEKSRCVFLTVVIDSNLEYCAFTAFLSFMLAKTTLVER